MIEREIEGRSIARSHGGSTVARCSRVVEVVGSGLGLCSGDGNLRATCAVAHIVYLTAVAVCAGREGKFRDNMDITRSHIFIALPMCLY